MVPRIIVVNIQCCTDTSMDVRMGLFGDVVKSLCKLSSLSKALGSSTSPNTTDDELNWTKVPLTHERL